MDQFTEKARKQIGGASMDRISRILNDNQHMFKSREHLLDFYTELKHGMAELYDEEQEFNEKARKAHQLRLMGKINSARGFPHLNEEEKGMATVNKIKAVKTYRDRIDCPLKVAIGKVEGYLHDMD